VVNFNYDREGGINVLKNKKGFTLVELLAVIVILAIILAIAVPGISGIIASAQKGAFESDVKMILTGIEYKNTESLINSGVTGALADGANQNIEGTLSTYGGNSANYTVFTVTISGGKITACSATADATGKFAKAYTASGTRASLTIGG
jgi:type IV pilus assembly protein PilA